MALGESQSHLPPEFCSGPLLLRDGDTLRVRLGMIYCPPLPTPFVQQRPLRVSMIMVFNLLRKFVAFLGTLANLGRRSEPLVCCLRPRCDSLQVPILAFRSDVLLQPLE